MQSTETGRMRFSSLKESGGGRDLFSFDNFYYQQYESEGDGILGRFTKYVVASTIGCSRYSPKSETSIAQRSNRPVERPRDALLPE